MACELMNADHVCLPATLSMLQTWDGGLKTIEGMGLDSGLVLWVSRHTSGSYVSANFSWHLYALLIISTAVLCPSAELSCHRGDPHCQNHHAPLHIHGSWWQAGLAVTVTRSGLLWCLPRENCWSRDTPIPCATWRSSDKRSISSWEVEG